MVKITDVSADGLAGRHGVCAGDVLCRINGNEIRDVLDYRFYLTDRVVTLSLLRDGQPVCVVLHKGEYDDIGLEFETPLMDRKHTCKNGCIFCFIDQNPPGMRESIYFKDDDSRLSFLHGNYVTLTNMTDEDVARIVKMRMSPLNISVHTTDPQLRVKMMKNKRAGEVLAYLDVFRDAGLSMCGQVVLCRGVNDGEALERTMRDLSAYFPQMGSVSVVPAGLTRYRDKLYPLSDFTPREAGMVIDQVDAFAQRMLRERGSRMFFPADEFFLKAGRPIPSAGYYEDYAQLDNGVGMLRSFSDEVDGALEHSALSAPAPRARTVSVATGVAAYPTIVALAKKAEAMYAGLRVLVYRIVNRFFGESITVSGLMTGRDLAEQLVGMPLGEELLLPENALRQGEDVFLCGMRIGELAQKLGVAVRAVPTDGFSFLEALLGQTDA